MKKEKLALHGGPKTISKEFDRYNSIGIEEVEAAKAVVETGVLSKFLGCWDADFYGGPKVQEFERACEKYFDVEHAVTVNSWTSGLIAAVGAIGIEPGDEVIVTPWTMCASATAILQWNAIPVFADIEPDTFNIDPKSVEANITPYTKAIMAVDIFGHSCDIDALMQIAKRHDLKVITDTAQAPGTFNNGRVTGTLGHVGGYSLNYHKHIHTGEGGMLNEGLKGLKGLKIPTVKDECTHAYYMYCLTLDVRQLGVSRSKIFAALEAEGVTGLSEGYVNVHMLPMYQQKIAYGSKGFPWTSDICKRDVSYEKGICPVAEELHDKTLLGYEMCMHDLNDQDVALVVAAFEKVWDHLSSI